VRVVVFEAFKCGMHEKVYTEVEKLRGLTVVVRAVTINGVCLR
jgi:hypothetical protein